MPNRNQIIIFSVLGIIAFLIGYFKDSINISIGKRAEVQEPIAPTIVTNVITNLANNVVTNVITNTVPVQPKPNPVKPQPLTPRNLTLEEAAQLIEYPANARASGIPRTITLEEKDIVGTYERKSGANTYRWVLLDNGIREHYVNGKIKDKAEWSIVDNEIHGEFPNSHVDVCRLNPDNRITGIAVIKDGKRFDIPKEQQSTWKKINQPKPTRTITLEEKDIIGTYERKSGANTIRYVFLANGTKEGYWNGEKGPTVYKWSIVDNEIHIKYPNSLVSVCRINPDNSLIWIAIIRDGKRTDESNEDQSTYKKIK